VGHIQEAVDKHWSVEKLADFLHCDPDEAAACLRRFHMSKKVNAKETTAGRMREAVFEWMAEVAGVADLDEKTRRKLADDLAKMLGNQLFVAAQANEDLLKLSMELEGKEAADAALPKEKPSGEAPPKWGPQWKD
jgi:chromosome condensin MukBEF MukE localization factor